METTDDVPGTPTRTDASLVGHTAKMPDSVVLLSTPGGLSAIGIAGVVIGPLVAALFLVVWDMLAEENASPSTN